MRRDHRGYESGGVSGVHGDSLARGLTGEVGYLAAPTTMRHAHCKIPVTATNNQGQSVTTEIEIIAPPPPPWHAESDHTRGEAAMTEARPGGSPTVLRMILGR